MNFINTCIDHLKVRVDTQTPGLRIDACIYMYDIAVIIDLSLLSKAYWKIHCWNYKLFVHDFLISIKAAYVKLCQCSAHDHFN